MRSRDLSLFSLFRPLSLALLLSSVAALAAPARAQAGSVHPLPQEPTINFPGKDQQAETLVMYQTLINGKIHGYFKTGGTSFYKGGGSVRRFTFTAPLPAITSTFAGPTVAARVADGNYNLNLSKAQGPQSLLLDEADGLIFVGATGHGDPRGGSPLARTVSVILSEKTAPFGEKFPVPLSGNNVPMSHVPTDLRDATFSGRGPEGFALLDQALFRYVFVNNYHEGTVSVFGIDKANPFLFGPFPLCEFDIDKVPNQAPLGVWPEPAGNLNRPLAIAEFVCIKELLNKYLLVGLNFDPPPENCPLPPELCMGLDGEPDEGFTDYLMYVDVTNFTGDCSTLVPAAIPLGPSIQGTVVSIAVHPDQDLAYVLSADFGLPHQNEEQDAYLYAVDLCQKLTVKTINLTAAPSQGGLGLPFNSAEKIVAVRNSNLTSSIDRLYIGTERVRTGPQTDDGHILVFDISGNKKTSPTLLRDFFPLPDPVPNSSFRVGAVVAVPVNTAFLGTGPNDLKRNVILAVGSDAGAAQDKPDRFIIFEDR